MLFTDRIFFAFLLATFAIYYLSRSAVWQIAVLLIASIVFYAYSQPYLLCLLAISATLSIVTSHKIDKAGNSGERRLWALLGVGLNLAVLAFFKYGRLFFSSLTGVAPSAHGDILETLLALPLPIGISFYTFHGISLLIDVFRARENRKIADPLGDKRGFFDHGMRTAFYLTFFPQLIAGPIVKAKDFYPQMWGKDFAAIEWYGAVKALIVGFFLKSVVADNLAQHTYLLQPPYCYAYSSLNLIVLLAAYSIQIFSDFAGYSLIAIGLAKLFGYNLPDNFRFPYVAQTFSEFWTRWHMSLSAWLRDYVYYPLGGNRRGARRTYVNLMLVMALGGLWHGAAWSYAVWGIWHGTALIAERTLRNTRFYISQLGAIKLFRWALVFSVVTVGWVLFKLPDFGQVRELVTVFWSNRNMRFSSSVPFLIFLYSAPVVLYHLLYIFREARPIAFKRFWSEGIECVGLGVLLSAIALQAGSPAPFIYFQF